MCVVDPGVQCKKPLNVAIVFHIEQKENKRERTWLGGGSDTIKIRKRREKNRGSAFVVGDQDFCESVIAKLVSVITLMYSH